MKTKILSLMFILTSCMCLLSCSGDESESLDSGLKGWYISKNGIPHIVDFASLNIAIRNNQLLYSSKYIGDVYASRDIFFFSDGSFGDFDYDKGIFEDYDDKMGWELSKEVIRIIDDETLIRAFVGLYDKDMVNNDNLVSYYRIYAGEIFGYLDYMGYDNISTYYKAGNKIILSSGDIYTIVDGGLVREGYSMSEVMTKYDPSKVY